MEEGRDISVQIQERVEFDGGFALLERCPWEDREAEIDGGRVEGIDGLVEIDAKVVLGVQAAGDVDEGLGEIGVDAPIAPFVGIGQGGAGDMSPDAHVVELALPGAKAGLDIAQAFAIGQLRKRHAQVLIEAGKGLHLVMAAIALDAAA